MKRRSLPLLTLLFCATAHADHNAVNLKDFRSVCLNVLVDIKEKEDEALSQDVFSTLMDQFEAAGITVMNTPCQNRSSAAARQVNVGFTFNTTRNGAGYFGQLEAWLPKDGKYVEPILWNSYIYGVTGGDNLNDLSSELASELAEIFVDLWDKSH